MVLTSIHAGHRTSPHRSPAEYENKWIDFVDATDWLDEVDYSFFAIAELPQWGSQTKNQNSLCGKLFDIKLSGM